MKKRRLIYLSYEVDQILNKIYIDRIKNNKKTSLSIIVEEAINLLYKELNECRNATKIKQI